MVSTGVVNLRKRVAVRDRYKIRKLKIKRQQYCCCCCLIKAAVFTGNTAARIKASISGAREPGYALTPVTV